MQCANNALHLRELLDMPLSIVINQASHHHVQCVERVNPLRAVDEWIAGYGDRFSVNECWDRFVEHSPFYTNRKKYEPEPYFYGGVNFRIFFEYRYFVAKGGASRDDFSKSVVKDLLKVGKVQYGTSPAEAYNYLVEQFTVHSEDAGEPDQCFMALWDIANCSNR